MSAEFILANTIDWLFIATALFTAFAIGASAERIKRCLAKLARRNVKSRPINPQPARLWAVVKQDWEVHGSN